MICLIPKIAESNMCRAVLPMLFGQEFFAGAVDALLFAVEFVEGADGAGDVVD
jgi:hypothetical protein